MKQKKPSGEDPVNAKIFNISHYLELYTPNPEDPLTLYKIVSMVYKPIERQIKEIFDENAYTTDQELTYHG